MVGFGPDGLGSPDHRYPVVVDGSAAFSEISYQLLLLMDVSFGVIGYICVFPPAQMPDVRWPERGRGAGGCPA